MSKESHDEGPSNEANSAGSGNPYADPIESGHRQPPQPRPNVFVDLMKVTGLALAVSLLIVVVGFGLLIGCCSMGGMQGN